MIKDEVKLSISGHEYTIKYPTVGQFYQIEANKQILSGGNYNTMVRSVLKATQTALDMIDIEATLTVLCPELIKDLKVERIADLDVRDFRAIYFAYVKEVVPFFRDINSMLNRAEESEEKKED